MSVVQSVLVIEEKNSCLDIQSICDHQNWFCKSLSLKIALNLNKILSNMIFLPLGITLPLQYVGLVLMMFFGQDNWQSTLLYFINTLKFHKAWCNSTDNERLNKFFHHHRHKVLHLLIMLSFYVFRGLKLWVFKAEGHSSAFLIEVMTKCCQNILHTAPQSIAFVPTYKQSQRRNA